MPQLIKDHSQRLAAHITLQAMALNIPDTPNHPNKHPFTGVLTKLDQPSDAPPSGSTGKRTLLTRGAAERALPSLLAMPLDFTENFDGHDVKKKIGVITEANIVGDEIHIAGFLYAADFPDEVRRIKAMKNVLGFSWELADIYTPDVRGDPLVITDATFTGAAVLRKDKAAYQTTSIAAAKETTDMTPEELKALLDSALKANNTALEASIMASVDKKLETVTKVVQPLQAAAQHMAAVEPHAKALESCAAGMDKAGVGGGPRGHVRACMAMAAHLRAEAGSGRIASDWPGYDGSHEGSGFPMRASADDVTKAVKDATDGLTKQLADQKASFETQIKDMKASADAGKTPNGGTGTGDAAVRKTLSPQITGLMAKAQINLPTNGEKLNVADVDKALASVNLNLSQRMEVKNSLQKIGAL